MSSFIKSNDFTKAVMDRVKTDKTFKCGRSYPDLLIWTRLCVPLTNSEIFSLLPATLQKVWTEEETAFLLFDRAAQKPDRFFAQNLAANLVCFRRIDQHNDEIVSLKEQLNHLSGQFNALSSTVFDAVERLVALEEENRSLKHQLSTNGIIKETTNVECLQLEGQKSQFIPMELGKSKPVAAFCEKDAITRYAL